MQQHESRHRCSSSSNISSDVGGGGGGGGGGRYTFDPFNPLNQLITERDVLGLLETYGIGKEFKIHNFNLFKRAFIHRSYVKRPQTENVKNGIHLIPKPDNCLPLFQKSNERLEFLGDGLLELITKFYLYRRFPNENEGFMTEKKIALVKNESIGKIALEMGLHKWFILSNHAEQKQTRTNLKKLGCLFESFIGALFLECNKIQIHDDDKWFADTFVTGPGFQMVQLFVENIFETHVDWTYLINNNDNFKNIFQVIIQKEFKVTPEYYEIVLPVPATTSNSSSNSEDKVFHMGVYLSVGNEFVDPNTIDSTRYIHEFASFRDIHAAIHANGQKIFLSLGKGSHKNKKKAEQMACDDAIQRISSFLPASHIIPVCLPHTMPACLP